MDNASITTTSPIKTIKTIVVFIIFIYIVVTMNKHFFHIYEDILKNTDEILTNYTKYIYIYVPFVFWFASKAKYFKYDDGYFELYISKMLKSVIDHKSYYSKTPYFHGALSNIAIYIFSLLAVASGAGLGDEGVIIYSSISLLLYFYFKTKDILGIHNVYTEVIIYLGYAIGFTIIFGSAITTLFYILETMLHYKDANFFSNFGIMICAIPFIKFLVKEEENPIKIDKITFEYNNVAYISIFAILMGVLSFFILKNTHFLFTFIKNSKFNNLYVIVFGFLLAFMIKQIGFPSMSFGLSEINEGFQATINKQKLKKLEEDKNYSELNRLKQLEKEGKFDTKNRFNIYSVFGRMVNCIISISSGLTGGLVIPTMTIGCGVGSVLSKYTPIPQENLMYLGMTSFLSPFLDAPITSALVINKISNQPYHTLPLSLCVSFISYFTYTFLKKHLY
jgi:H+/Cl- antiporter ClcA